MGRGLYDGSRAAFGLFRLREVGGVFHEDSRANEH